MLVIFFCFGLYYIVLQASPSPITQSDRSGDIVITECSKYQLFLDNSVYHFNNTMFVVGSIWIKRFDGDSNILSQDLSGCVIGGSMRLGSYMYILSIHMGHLLYSVICT